MARERLDFGESRLRLQTLIRLRWVAVLGQTLTVLGVYFGLGFALPLAACLAVISLSALSNIALQRAFPPSHRLQSTHAMLMLGYDVLQLSALLYLTGGLENPFALLMVVPVSVSASTQPLRITVALGTLAVACATLLVLKHQPLPWHAVGREPMPLVYLIGIWTALVSCIAFMATYAWRTAQETRQMSDALAATELLLAREQQLSALDGLAAAAAHELGTPLSTIALVAKELEREVPADSPLRDDILLLRTQAARCRDILGALSENTGETDAMYSQMSLGHLIEEVVEPYRIFDIEIEVMLRPPPARNGQAAEPEPVIARNAGVLYALTNLVENAVDYASSKVKIIADWNKDDIHLAIMDDGPGFAPHILGRLGEPYVTTRARQQNAEQDAGSEGMGLGFFIAKTLLERYNATLKLDNRPAPATGATVEVTLKRAGWNSAWAVGRN
ncbi:MULTISPECIES: ActS/PrrB/RegB family redox-sensitive histidine kinase [Rhodomicrobium]|uniref:ActS/PrrB/RegB family redox-sensitive histidine kinase n=1 Tax=Rhodomicrobium TaxID=1068 RepID=UPI000B4A57C2|nr:MULTISPECIES: ActS/PrrB/RegB family redox-sensitive histidine kinase [Rhodomicrobium]